MKLYYKALRYAYVLDPPHYRDLVHNAYIYFHKKSNGENLFEQHEGYILRCVKFMWKWRVSNESFNKEFHEYDEAAGVFGINPTHSDKFCTDKRNPHTDLESKEFVDLVFKRVGSYHSGGLSSVDPKVLVQVLDYLQRGYTGNEIGTTMDLSAQTISNHKKKIQALVGNFTQKPLS